MTIAVANAKEQKKSFGGKSATTLSAYFSWGTLVWAYCFSAVLVQLVQIFCVVAGLASTTFSNSTNYLNLLLININKS